MFGFVTASETELTKEQKNRYQSVYCGICRQIRERCSQRARLGLSYDMAFLALLLMSLYEPEEQQGNRACGLHPLNPRCWVDNEYVQYAADLNVILTYYKAQDDWLDDHRRAARWLAKSLESGLEELSKRYPRQFQAVEEGISHLAQLEKQGCSNPDEPANCFGHLMGELLVYRDDLWAPHLRELGFYLGRFIYLADAYVDYPKDLKKKKYNPLPPNQEDQWEDYLVLAMGKCTECYERLPLVQDKVILDNILYSGVWTQIKTKGEKS